MTDLIFRLDSLDEAFHFANAYDKVRNQVPGGHGINVVGSSALANLHDRETRVWKVILATDGPKTLMALSAHLHAEMPSEFFSAVEYVENPMETVKKDSQPGLAPQNGTEGLVPVSPDENGIAEEYQPRPDEPSEEFDEETDDEAEDDEETVGSSSEVTRVRRKRPPITVKGRNPAITIEKTD